MYLEIKYPPPSPVTGHVEMRMVNTSSSSRCFILALGIGIQLGLDWNKDTAGILQFTEEYTEDTEEYVCLTRTEAGSSGMEARTSTSKPLLPHRILIFKEIREEELEWIISSKPLTKV